MGDAAGPNAPLGDKFLALVDNMEMSREQSKDFTSVVLRPQMRVTVSKTSKVGLVAGIPMDTRYDSHSFFVRWIYEPGRKQK